MSAAKGVPVLLTRSAASGVEFLAFVATMLLTSLVHCFVDAV